MIKTASGVHDARDLNLLRSPEPTGGAFSRGLSHKTRMVVSTSVKITTIVGLIYHLFLLEFPFLVDSGLLLALEWTITCNE